SKKVEVPSKKVEVPSKKVEVLSKKVEVPSKKVEAIIFPPAPNTVQLRLKLFAKVNFFNEPPRTPRTQR
ncbi:hypothetical protein, partial [Nostoc sp.]|uniref:hypothetical protein n=1 Tax=Nostoc sp. TaxID=1180 RepID=UPI002FF6C075